MYLNNKKYGCIDVGLKRIGVAISLMPGISTPKDAILRKNRNQAAKEVDDFLKYWDIDILVIGMPYSNEQMQKRINHFSKLLEFNKEIVFQNEDMSSIEAEELTKGEIKHKRDGRIDSISAKIILDRYLKN
jgi:putative Holliday junction resolvase